MKIIKDPSIRSYELTYLVPTTFSESELAQTREKVTKLVTRHKGKVLETQDMGKKPLAYVIRTGGKAYREAYYTFLKLQFESTVAPAFERDVYLVDNIIRQLMILAEDVVVTQDESKKE